MPLKSATAAAVAMTMLRLAYAGPAIELRDVLPEPELEHVPSLVLGTPVEVLTLAATAKIDRATVTLRLSTERTNATLTLWLSTGEVTGREVAMTIDVPHGARVTGLANTVRGTRTAATPLSVSAARDRYDQTVERRVRAPLLEHTESRRRHDRLTLRVSSLEKTSPAIVEIEMQLAPSAGFALDPGGQRIKRVDLDIDGKMQMWNGLQTRRAIKLPVPHRHSSWMTDDPTLRPVTAVTSLFAGEPERRRAIKTKTAPIIIQPTAISCGFGPSPPIRRTVKRHHAQLRHCYMREAQRDPSLEGTVELHFLILSTGTTDAITVDGPLASDAVKACIADHAASWTFHESDGTTRVNYPLTFVLNR